MTTRSLAWKQPVYNENVIVHLYMFYRITDVGRDITEARIQIVYNIVQLKVSNDSIGV
jgi:hypothetical protein